MAVRLVRIDRFPIKSFDGATAERARVLPSGAIEQDRRFAVFAAGGRFVTAKRTPRFHALRTEFAADFSEVTLADRHSGREEAFPLVAGGEPLQRRLSEQFGLPVTLREDAAAGFPDDTLASGPTLISAETLAAVGEWFGFSAEEARRRFRANLVIEGGGPFWEDRLFGPPGEPIGFRVGGLTFFGTNPCARCAVPGRDPDTGEPIRGFMRTFADRRRASLPPWAAPDAFDHYFRLAVNTRLYAPADGGEIAVGDVVEMIDG